MGTLSVRENLTFSAALRLPGSVSKSEREKRVDDVISELGLQDCAETKVCGYDDVYSQSSSSIKYRK